MPNNTFTDFKSLARAISQVENELPGAAEMLAQLKPHNMPVIGFTGPPGAGKSTLLNAIISLLSEQQKQIGLILVDPSSPFNLGALLGDRLRMSAHFEKANVFIRSVATRGSLGGLSDKIIEVVEAMRAYAFDYIFIETVGVGQSEVEIAGIADVTVVVLVPESGDGVQTMKAGLVEVADIFAVNKADRADAEALVNSLTLQLQLNHREDIPVLKTVAVESKGVKELLDEISRQKDTKRGREKKLQLLGEKALRLIAKSRMKDFDSAILQQKLKEQMDLPGFNLYRFISGYL